MRVKGYMRTNVNYSYQYVEIDTPDLIDDEGESVPYYNPYAAWGDQSYHMSSITPTLYRSTVNSPITPTRGSLFLVGCKFAGGILGAPLVLAIKKASTCLQVIVY